MYGIFTYMWLISMVNVGKYTSPMDPQKIKILNIIHAKKPWSDAWKIQLMAYGFLTSSKIATKKSMPNCQLEFEK